MNVFIIKPGVDSKGADTIISRMGASRKVDLIADHETNIANIVHRQTDRGDNINCILVDESQFLTPDHVDQLLELTVKDAIPVVAYGIRSDFQTLAFPGSKRLFEVAHSIEELKTICRCGKKALFNARKVDGQFVFEGSQIAIDGEHSVEYESLCASCYANEKIKVA